MLCQESRLVCYNVFILGDHRLDCDARAMTRSTAKLSHLLILTLYLLLALALTWPLVTHIATHIPGTAVWAFDESTFVWNMWWFKFSLLTLGASPLHTDYIFYPLGVDLVLYTFNFFNAMLGLPLTMLVPLPMASNLAILFAYVMSGYGTYLLMCYLLVRYGRRAVLDRGSGSAPVNVLHVQLAALVAGAAYAFAASRMVYAALGHYDMVTAQWFPFYALFLLKALNRPGYRYPVLAGVCAAFALLAEMIFGVFLLLLTLVLVFGQLAGGGWQRLPSVLSRLALIALTTALLWSPVMVPILRAFAQADYALTGWGEGLKLSADVVGWFTPTALHPWWGAPDWPAHLRAVVEGKAQFRDVNTVFLGYGILALAVVGAVTAWRVARAWVWSAVLFALFTLGPLLQVNGRYLFPLDNLLREQGLAQDVTFPLPFALLHYIPIIQANRAPNRFSVVLCLALAVLVGYGVWQLMRYAARLVPRAAWAVACLALPVVLVDQLSVPLPLTDARLPAPYDRLASEPDAYAILQLPLGWRNSFGTRGAEETRLQYYQAFHHKYMLAGNISRAPAFKFDYFTRIPLFRALIEVESYHQPDAETLARAAAQASELMTLYDIRYLAVHDPIPLRYPYVDTMPATRELALALLPVESQPLASADGVTLYRVLQAPLPDTFRIDLGEWSAAPYRAEGWAEDEQVFGTTANWVTDSQARLFFPVRGGGDRRLALRIAPFAYPGAPRQRVSLELNGHALGYEVGLEEGWQIVSVRLPEVYLRPGLNALVLHFDHLASPASVLGASDDRTLAAALDWFEVGLPR